MRLEILNEAGYEPPTIESWPTLLMPRSIHARISSVCNLNCQFCERESWKSGGKEREKDMLPEVWAALVDRFIPHALGVELCGLGEPTIARLFPTACSDVLRLGKQLYFPTNGHFLHTKHVIDAVGDTPRVSVSVDAWDAESYARIRGGDWDKLCASVKAFRERVPKAFLHSQYTAGEYNIDGFPQFMRWAAENGFQEVVLRPVQAHTVDRESVSLRFHEDRTRKAIDEARVIAQDAGIWFTAAEIPFSTSTASGDPRIERLRRYLDVVPQAFTLICDLDTSTLSSTAVFTLRDGIEGFGAPGSDLQQLTRLAPRDPGQQMVYSSAALIAAWDGPLWSCFAGHVVGHTAKDDYHSVVRNPRYQAFLHARTDGNGAVAKEPWCHYCSRVI